MVTMLAPDKVPIGTEQERIARPLIWTVQAPHCAIPQPNFVPVSPTASRNAQSKGVSGSRSMSWWVPLTVSVIIWLFFGWKPDLTGQYGLRLVEGDHLINLTRQADHGFVKSATEIERKFRSHAGGFLRLNGNFPLSLPSLRKRA